MNQRWWRPVSLRCASISACLSPCPSRWRVRASLWGWALQAGYLLLPAAQSGNQRAAHCHSSHLDRDDRRLHSGGRLPADRWPSLYPHHVFHRLPPAGQPAGPAPGARVTRSEHRKCKSGLHQQSAFCLWFKASGLAEGFGLWKISFPKYRHKNAHCLGAGTVQQDRQGLRLGGQLLTGGSGLLTGGRIGLNDRGNLIQSHSNLCDCR